MKAQNNYRIQTQQAMAHFLTYDQAALLHKLSLDSDEKYLYTAMFSRPYRICRTTGAISSPEGGIWQPTESFEEIMTLLDLVCDSREDRRTTGEWKNMRDFGLRFHSGLLASGSDPWAAEFQARPEDFSRACRTLNGRPMETGDIAWAIPCFETLCIGLRLWFGDEEFPPALHFLWDENALMYLRYETMYFAKGLLLRRIREEMDRQ